MNARDTSHRDRVNAALRFEKPDRTPRDFAAVPEIWQGLGEHFGVDDRHEILRRLDVDCRIVSYDSFCAPPGIDALDIDENASMERSSVGGMWRRVEPDGSNRDIWGAHRRPTANEFGMLDQFASHPLESAGTLDDLRQYDWPRPDWWDFSDLRAVIAELNAAEVYSIRFRLGSFFETAWSLYGFEHFLVDMALDPTLPRYVLDRIAEVHFENLRTVLDVAGDLIDIVYYYDDVASQQGLLIGPDMYESFLEPYHQRVIEIARSHGKPTMMHSCGSVYPMIDRLIDMGLAVLNPIQPMAADMQPERLAAEFAGRIAFHGGIDIQHFMPKASVAEVVDNVARTADLLGASGGYIMSGSHHIQADTPVENVLAMYAL